MENEPIRSGTLPVAPEVGDFIEVAEWGLTGCVMAIELRNLHSPDSEFIIDLQESPEQESGFRRYCIPKDLITAWIP